MELLVVWLDTVFPVLPGALAGLVRRRLLLQTRRLAPSPDPLLEEGSLRLLAPWTGSQPQRSDAVSPQTVAASTPRMFVCCP